jgi:rhodanese-related sulfurtransferase
MNLIKIITSFSLIFTSISAFDPLIESRCVQSEIAVTTAEYGHIDAKGLKSLIDSGLPIVILDARGHKWSDPNKLPGALSASYESSFDELETIIPTQQTLVVVYCYSSTCPLCCKLARRLVEFGYDNVVEYPGGLKEWRDIAEYPVEEHTRRN